MCDQVYKFRYVEEKNCIKVAQWSELRPLVWMLLYMLLHITSSGISGRTTALFSNNLDGGMAMLALYQRVILVKMFTIGSFRLILGHTYIKMQPASLECV